MKAAALAGARPSRDRRGTEAFSLLEMAIVLLIMAIGGAVVIPLVTAGWDAREVRRAARQIASTMHYCRGEALGLGEPQELVLDVHENMIRTTGWGRWAVLTERAIITGISGGNEIGDGVVQIVFFPNGSTSGVEVVVASRRDPRERRLHVFLDPLLGTVRVEDGA